MTPPSGGCSNVSSMRRGRSSAMRWTLGAARDLPIASIGEGARVGCRWGRSGRKMVVVMQEGATEEQIQSVISKLMEMGFDIHRSTGVAQTVLGAVGVKPDFDHRDIELLDGVQGVHRISSPYKLASRHFRP